MTTTFDVTDYVSGDTLRLRFTVLHPDGGVFPNLDTCQIEWTLLRPTPLGVPEPHLLKAIGTGVTIIDVETGDVAVDIEQGEIPAIGAFVHSLVVTTADGHKYTEIRGVFSPTTNL